LPDSEDAGRMRVALDSSVLLGRWRTHLVAGAHLRLFEGYWSSWIVSEVVRKRTEWVVRQAAREGSDVSETLRRVNASRDRINDLVRDLSAVLRSVDYRDAPSLDLSWLSDPDDVPVVQTALAARAELLVTQNKRDFPWGERRSGVLFMSAEDFLDLLYRTFPSSEETISALVE
jgi:hypothetical protein